MRQPSPRRRVSVSPCRTCLTGARALGADDHFGSGIEDQFLVAFDINRADARRTADDGAEHRAFDAAGDAADDGPRRAADRAARLRILRAAAGLDVAFFVN